MDLFFLRMLTINFLGGSAKKLHLLDQIYYHLLIGESSISWTGWTLLKIEGDERIRRFSATILENFIQFFNNYLK